MTGNRPTAAAVGHVVIAELEISPGHMEAFVALAQGFAAECLAREPGCRQFQVVRLDTTRDHVLFFEAYDDLDAFAVHRASDHLARFKAAFQDMVTGEEPLRRGKLELEVTADSSHIAWRSGSSVSTRPAGRRCRSCHAVPGGQNTCASSESPSMSAKSVESSSSTDARGGCTPSTCAGGAFRLDEEYVAC